ncbi:ATP-binding cassette domain-containing protein [Celerinatantimonas sp. YJH-8]|uniref:ATP-binding cassette domain-containing protein n=1 Tax=Celerinatantimonas sp. YJH-8 TaxID=3228714 RepID=UPI0038C67226
MNQQTPSWEHTPLITLFSHFPVAAEEFTRLQLPNYLARQTLNEYIQHLDENELEELGYAREQLLEHFLTLLQEQQGVLQPTVYSIQSLTLLPGHNKSGEAEPITLTLRPGSITSIVGPTGSGKSRLLADIEWLAQKDTPTGRTILIDDKLPDPEHRFSLEHKLVAQLSQNMNFVMDTSVADFIQLHAQSRHQDNPQIVQTILDQANQLAGEPFAANTPITGLSGGQSRALMIADTAFLSASPVVLIDEVENAGIDRKKALQLLIRNEKIVLIATHDPLLALMAEQRLVIRNGGIAECRTTSDIEREQLHKLEIMDAKVQSLRERLRHGEEIVAD